MAFFAYIDCSGSGLDPNSTVITAAGYVAHEDEWAKFERLWTAALQKHGVKALHMKEFAHSAKKSEFASWKGKEDKRIAFMSDMTGVIKSCDLQRVSMTIVLAHYDECNRKYRMRETDLTPYTTAVLKAISHLVSWHRERAFNEPLMILLEKGDNDQATLGRFLGRLSEWDIDLVTPPIPQKKQWKDASGVTHYCVPFQAADFLCYEHAKMHTDYLVKGKTTVRETIFQVEYPPKGDELMAQLMTSKWLEAMAKQWKITPRFNHCTSGNDEGLAADPLCYLNIDEPLISDSSPESRSKKPPRAVVEAFAWLPRF